MIRLHRSHMHRLAVAFACAAFLAPLAAQAQSKGKAAEGLSKATQAQIRAADVPLKEANALRDLGQFEPAIAKYTEAIKLAPDLFQGYANRGFSRVELGVIKRDMKTDAAAQTQADELFKLGTEDYEMAIKLVPKDKAVVLRNDRANVLTRAGNYEVAFADFDILMKDDPKNLKSYYFNRGVAHLDKATALRDKVRLEKKNNDAAVAAAKPEFDLANADFTKVIELDPKMAAAYVNRGTSNTRAFELESAAEDFTKAIEIDPTNKRAYRGRAEVTKALADGFRQMGDKDKSAQMKASSDSDLAKYEELLKAPPAPTAAPSPASAPVPAKKP